MTSISFNYLGHMIIVYDANDSEVEAIRIISRNHATLKRTARHLVASLLERFPNLTIETSRR